MQKASRYFVSVVVTQMFLLFVFSRKRSKVHEEVEGTRPYVKKPLNAFMVYMKEQRPYIDLELKSKGNGVVNMYLAQKVCYLYIVYSYIIVYII